MSGHPVALNHMHSKAAQTLNGRREFNSFHRAVSTIGMKFSDRYNAVHTAPSATALLGTMCREGLCAQQASEVLQATCGTGPGPDWLLGKLGDIGYADMHRRAGRALRRRKYPALQV